VLEVILDKPRPTRSFAIFRAPPTPPARRPPGHRFGPFGSFGSSDGSLPNRDHARRKRARTHQTALVFRAVDAGVVTPEFFLGRRTIELADGAPVPALSSTDASAALSQYNASPASHLHAQGPEAAFQRGIYGDNERVISLGEGRVVIPDGFTSQYGAIGDAKFVASERSFYIPDSMGNTALGRIAQERMDRTLARLGSGANALGGNGVVEITTNNVQAAQFIEARMRALGVHGYVRIIEGAP
jgi:hypothetical protein